MIKLELTQEQIEKRSFDLESRINGFSFKIKDKLISAGKKLEDSSSESAVSAIYSGFSILDLIWHSVVKTHRKESIVGILTAAYIGADYGLYNLTAKKTGRIKSMSRNVFSGKQIDFNQTYPYPLDDLLDIYSNGVDEYKNAGLSNITEQFFNWVKNRVIVESSKYPEIKEQLQDVRGNIDQIYSFRGISSKVKRSVDKSNKLIWNKFGGYHNVVDYLKTQAKFIQNFDYLISLDVLDHGDLLPKATILHGPPGTGKTTLLRIFCNEAGLPYEMFSCSEIGSQYVFGSSINIQNYFDEAASYIKRKESKFALVVIDELDALGRKRAYKSNGSNEDNKLVTTICENLDGHLAVDGVLVYGLTNMGDVLDPALTRPGRFETWLEMGFPNRKELNEIFSIYLAGRGVGKVDVEHIINKYVDLKWTGALVEKVVIDAKRAKLDNHLDGQEQYLINTDDVCKQIELYQRRDLNKKWLE
ncbi:MAG: VCP-like ATPase [Candidatus Woesearchaeota archaeon]|nr:VCP-like ATPase [Candidatus Woesearchaeota archaeon]